MEISSAASRRLYYQPIYSASKDESRLFQRVIQASTSLEVRELKQILQERKIAHTQQQSLSEITELVAFASLFLCLVPAIEIPSYKNPSPFGLKQGSYRMLNMSTNRTWFELDNPLSNLPDTFPSILTTCFCAAIILAAWVNCVVKFKRLGSDERAFNDNADRENEKIDAHINQLTYVVPQGSEKVVPRDIAVGFPYLSESHLAALNFAELKAARKTHQDLFEKHLNNRCFATEQLEIWHLFKHILDADSKLRRKILANHNHREIIGSNPQFFQMLVRHLHPLDHKIAVLMAKILDEHIISKLDSQHTLPNSLSIIKAVAEGSRLHVVLSPSFAKIDVSLGSGDEVPFDKFLQTGKLHIHDLDELYAHFIACLKQNKLEIADWFEVYLSEHIAHFAVQPRLSSVMESATLFNLDRFKFRIDRHLCLEPFPSFCSEEFTTSFLFAKEHGLKRYKNALKEEYLRKLSEHAIAGDVNSMMTELQARLAQIELLFPDKQQRYLHILESKIVTIISQHPQLIEAFATQACERQNTWLLKIIHEIFETDPDLYSGFWLSPLQSVDVKVED